MQLVQDWVKGAWGQSWRRVGTPFPARKPWSVQGQLAGPCVCVCVGGWFWLLCEPTSASPGPMKLTVRTQPLLPHTPHPSNSAHDTVHEIPSNLHDPPCQSPQPPTSRSKWQAWQPHQQPAATTCEHATHMPVAAQPFHDVTVPWLPNDKTTHPAQNTN